VENYDGEGEIRGTNPSTNVMETALFSTAPLSPRSAAERFGAPAQIRLSDLSIFRLPPMRRSMAIIKGYADDTDAAFVPSVANDEPDTIVVPAQHEGFQKVFLGENAWRAIRISGCMLPKIKYIAGYQTQPVSAVAPVARIEPYGDTGKYQLLFSEPAKQIGPIPLDSVGNAWSKPP
jgi:hypothetical protein